MSNFNNLKRTQKGNNLSFTKLPQINSKYEDTSSNLNYNLYLNSNSNLNLNPNSNLNTNLNSNSNVNFNPNNFKNLRNFQNSQSLLSLPNFKSGNYELIFPNHNPILVSNYNENMQIKTLGINTNDNLKVLFKKVFESLQCCKHF